MADITLESLQAGVDALNAVKDQLVAHINSRLEPIEAIAQKLNIMILDNPGYHTQPIEEAGNE